MFEWLKGLRRREHVEPPQETQHAEEVQRERFDEWESAMREVEKVQSIAAGKTPVPVRRR